MWSRRRPKPSRRSSQRIPAALAREHRITIEDIFDAMEYGGIKRLLPGDSILFRTGRNQLLQAHTAAEFARWGAAKGLPGIYVKEARWLAQYRPAVVSGDTWALEVLGRPELTGTTAFAVHQELIMRHGIRIGESVVLDALAEDGVYEFAYAVTPQYALGATAGNTPPMGLGQPKGSTESASVEGGCGELAAKVAASSLCSLTPKSGFT